MRKMLDQRRTSELYPAPVSTPAHSATLVDALHGIRGSDDFKINEFVSFYEILSHIYLAFRLIYLFGSWCRVSRFVARKFYII